MINIILLILLGLGTLTSFYISYLSLFEFHFILIASSIWGVGFLISFYLVYLHMLNALKK